ncbi:DUF6796 family protein [Hyphomonas sp.]|uniref:DUF6796 family protein n=1 Tax=Hyphomonas sp. TaxID=87 RepID=UPI0030FC0E6D
MTNAGANPRQNLVWFGIAGLVGALLTGIGEGLLQLVPGGNFTDPDYGYFLDITQARLMLGHYLSVSAAPLYLAGYWHLTGNLLPQAPRWRFVVFAFCAWAFILATVWIGQRALIAETVQSLSMDGASRDLLVRQTILHEPLVNALRFVMVAFSFIWTLRIFTGKSRYPRWMALFSPALLLALIFGLYAAAPEIGWLVLPTAMNTAHVILFTLSLLTTSQVKGQ